jgi:isocitrate dehydrogenase kinase/phosphatase
MDPMNESDLRVKVATLITRVFDSYLSEFLVITRRAKARFEQRDWRGAKRDSAERLSVYEKVLSQMSIQIEGMLGKSAHDRSVWISIKPVYAALISGRCNEDIAETFFNSVTRKLLRTVGIDREVEFFYLKTKPRRRNDGSPIIKKYGPGRTAKGLLRAIIEDHRFDANYEDLERDLDLVANEVDLYLWPITRENAEYSMEILTPCFYRNKVAYIVGRIALDSRTVPIIIPLYNDDSGIHIDSALMDEADANNIFGFAYSYFQVEADTPSELVDFLTSILPHKPLTDLYNAIGFYKHGKTEFYRDLHRFIHVSKEQFVIAPGKEGAVMIVFTLPHYKYVFKIIKDKPCFIRSSHITDKVLDRSEVQSRYRSVCNRDRAGRLVDTQEFENVRFKAKRYSQELLREFAIAAQDLVTVRDGYVVINHLYLQRRVTPLPMYFLQERDTTLIRRVVIDFGYFIKDLAATGLFPADLFNTWNYGVTEGNRVVMFDYDDIIPLESARFRCKPGPRDQFEETNPEEEWIVAEPTDFFLDEMDTFVGIPDPLKGIFNSVHRDLFTMQFWQNIKKRVSEGEIIDIIPYDRNKRFSRTTREA